MKVYRFRTPFRYFNLSLKGVITVCLIALPFLLLSFQNCARVGVSEIVAPLLAPSPAKLCDPKLSPKPCARDHGTGYQLCNYDGDSWGLCGLDKCDINYQLFRGECDFTGCTANSEAPCSGTNGFGTHLCNAQGTGYGTCTLNSCATGYFLNTSKNPKTCDTWICTPNQPQACPIANGTGQQTCNSIGSAWGGCTRTGCNALYHPNGSNGCDADVACVDVLTGQRVALNGVGTYQVNRGSAYCSYNGENVTGSCNFFTATCSILGWTSPYGNSSNPVNMTCGSGDVGTDLYPTCP